MPQIAALRSTSRQNIQILVDRLEADARVEMMPNPAHKRSALARLTPRGTHSLHAGEEGQKEILAQIGAGLSEEEISTVITVLRKVYGLLANDREKPLPPKRVVERTRPPLPRVEKPLASEPVAEEFPLNLL